MPDLIDAQAILNRFNEDDVGVLILQYPAAAAASAAGIGGCWVFDSVFAVECCGQITGGGCFSESLFAGKEQGMGNACFADKGLQEANRKSLPYNGIEYGHDAMALREKMQRQHLIVCDPVWNMWAAVVDGSAVGLVVHTFFEFFP